MKITSLKLSDIYRTQFVKRWHILNTPRQQTVAEHSYLVTMVVIDLCRRMGVPEEIKQQAILWALVHDLPEVVMGDSVSPVKNIARAEFNALEARIDPGREEFFGTLPAVVETIVKLADYIDAIKYLHEEGINGQAEIIRERLTRNMASFIIDAGTKHPEFSWSAGHSCLLDFIHGEQTYVDNLIP